MVVFGSPHTPQVALRPFSSAGFQAAGNPGVTFVAPYSWCSAGSSVAGMASSGAPIPGEWVHTAT
jgi:hypothetical protein